MRYFVALAALLLTLTACGSDGEDSATDPGPADGGSARMPASAPTAPGPVRSANLATVMDTGTPEMCLGPVAESYPPQCGGPEITNWDWAEHGQRTFDEQGDVRWGTYALTGTWDGTAFAVADAIPGPLYDAIAPEPSTPAAPDTAYTGDELEAIRAELEQLPGFQGGYAAEGRVNVEVIYDDGSLQAWADEEYGAGVVIVTGLLVDA